MLMAMSNAEKWLLHTKSGHFFLKNGRHALTSDILKKSQAF